MTAGGDTPQALFSALVAGLPLCAPHPDTGFPVAAIPAFDPKAYVQKKGVRDLSRTSQLACAAASRNAPGIKDLPMEEVGVVFGSAWGSLKTVVDFEREAYTEGPRFVDPIRFTETVANVPAGQVAIFYGWSAFNATVSAGSASGLAAVQRAIEFLEEGRGSVAVAGGGDELNLPLLRSLRLDGVTAGSAGSLPFASGRSGPVGGEGSCLLTLESESHARSRGALALGRIRAIAARFEAEEDAASSHATLSELLRELLDLSELGPGDVDLLVLSASGGAAGDEKEAAAVREVFGETPPPLVAPKGILGETWGASGPLAIVVACEAMRTGTVPGRPRGFVPAAELDWLPLPPEVLSLRVRHALVLDCAMTGHDLGVVLSAVG